MSLLIGILTVILIFTSIFLVLVVLMQRAKTDGGMGAAMGGGSMESTFGAETGNVLSGATIKAAIVFFVLSFVLYLANIYQSKHQVDAGDARLPTVTAPATSTKAPAATTVPLTIPVTAGPLPSATGPQATPPAPTPAAQPANPQPGEPKKP
jgi:preprotein translocase subunit SecG